MPPGDPIINMLQPDYTIVHRGDEDWKENKVKPGTTAVIFVSKRAAIDTEGYSKAAEEMEKAAERFPGYCGIHSVRGDDGVGITISYWGSDQAARAWKDDAAHSAIRERGRSTWYEWYELIVAQVTRSYSWQSETTSS